MRIVKLGAFHYLPADTPAGQVQQAIEQAFDYRDRVRRNDSPEAWRHILVGNSPAMQAILETVRLVAQRRSTVLITGETGTGKEMVARAIHAAGNRSRLQMVAVNCSALPENLLEAELFGHVKGAFTGAIQHRVGRFEQANNSTLFLDEIAEMPLDLQTKLLRVLQEREFQRLGSSDSVKVDVRVIAACNVDPLESIRLGKFREDLYYRLNVVPIQVPSLRERLSDVPVLVHHFLEKICRHEGIPAKKVSDETIDRLSRYSWPGNVRQLENAVEMAVALSGDRDTLYPGDFPLPSVAARKLPQPAAVPTQIAMPEDGIDFEHVIGAIERNLLEQALRRSNGNKKAAAELLRLKRTTLTAKLKSLETRVAC
ncbi:MAG: sigma-54-dependent Fis family transcriptional regulator [Bryobacterales bacterium]|nr:sigma-54-dependent Fis family transcriptional regulator [Bryobacterales bacterium]